MEMQPPPLRDSKAARYPENAIRVVYWRDWEAIAREEQAEERRRIVNDIFSNRVMAGLALLLIPVLLLLDFGTLSPDAFIVLSVLDVAIWIFFILEYVCRILVAEDRKQFILSPFGLFDLVIICAPAIALALGSGYRIAGYLRILRVAQVFQVLKIGGKTVHARISQQSPGPEDVPGTGLTLRAVPLADSQRGAGNDPVPWAEIPLGAAIPPGIQPGIWRHFSSWTSADLGKLSQFSGLPPYILQEKLWERAYSRGEVTGSLASIFLKIPRIVQESADTRKWLVAWDSLLIVYDQEGVMTFSRSDIPILDSLPSHAANEGILLSGPIVVYLTVRDSLKSIESILANAEEQVSNLEALPMNRLPSNFTAMMYTDQKVLDRIGSWLRHTKTALEQISGPGPQPSAPGAERLQSAINSYSSASDTAGNISDSFSRMVDFYLNMTSLSMNQVMKYLAVLTALTLIPALVGGLLGMNLAGNPWPVTLLPMITTVALFMLLTAWIYFNLGWLRR